MPSRVSPRAYYAVGAAQTLQNLSNLTDLISKRSRVALREYFVTTSLGAIDSAFDSADIQGDYDYDPPVSGQRRTRVEQYYKALDWTRTRDAKKSLAVVESIIVDLDVSIGGNPAVADSAAGHRTRILRALASDGWQFDGHRFAGATAVPHFEHIAESATKLDAPEFHRQVERMRASVESDPALALGTAKELVETACKTILEEHGRPVGSEWDIGRLIKEAREVLKLLPTDIPDSVKGAESIKRLLANLGSVVQGLGELRNLYGTGHGRSGKQRSIEPRHARLASGAAAALVTFLLETHWQRSEQAQPNRADPRSG